MTDPPRPIGIELPESYALERELGRGGMATVYLARDRKHDRPVAIKVLRPELAAALGAERFKREIRLAARLQHPHILTVFDSGGSGASLWFAMPYVEGESLRDRLRREGPLPVDEAVRIAREAAQALQFAHDHDVVHRDIKPENILLTPDGSTLVADFGIARGLDPGEERLTETGFAIGTPAYMSPEQASGERQVGPRSDVYSLGCVLYEMLTGETPFTGPNPQAILAKRFSGAVPSAAHLRAAVPPGLDTAVQRALATTPGDRFASARAFADALAANAPSAAGVAATAAGVHGESDGTARREITPTQPVPATRSTAGRNRRTALVAALAAAVIVGVGVGVALRRRAAASPDVAGGARRLAVLPFDNLGDSSTAYFADGMADAVRGKLASLPEFRVIARASSDQYRRTRATPETIGRELGVQYLVTATVRWDRRADGTSRVQVSPELVRTADGTTGWQQPFDAPMTDVFAVQADIASRVATALHVALDTTRRQALAQRPTTNLAAYDAYLRGMEIGGDVFTDPANQGRAMSYFAEAVRLDSSFAEAWARLGRALAFHYGTVAPRPETADSARRAIERARALAPGRPATLLAEATYNAFVRNDATASIASLEAGVRAEPGNAELLSGLAITHRIVGNWTQALQSDSAAVALDPRSTFAAGQLIRALLWLRQADDAVAAAQRAVSLSTSNVANLQLLVMAHLQRGDSTAARRVLREQGSAIAADRLATYFALYWDTYWVLDPSQQALLFTLPRSTFDNDVVSRALVLMETAGQRGDSAVARAYADTAQRAIAVALQGTPGDAQQHALRGLALSYLGRRAEAAAEIRRGIELAGVNTITVPYFRHLAARVAMFSGDHAGAIATLDSLLHTPYFITPGWLRVDRTWDPLRGDPRFERLTRGP